MTDAVNRTCPRGILAALALGAVACGSPEPSAPEPDPIEPAGFGAAWAEFSTPDQVASARSLLRQRQVAVNLAWPSTSIADPSRLELVRDCADQGVTVRPWLLLPEAEGYWPGSTNSQPFVKSARALMDAWDEAELAPTTLIVDMEMRHDRALEMNGFLSGGELDVVGLITFLRDGMNDVEYVSATEDYRLLVEDAHARGWTVHLTTLPQVLDDYADGDDAVRRSFGIPVEGIAWDVLSFQAYRTLFGDLFAGLGDGQRPSPFFVYDYGRDAVERFGDRAGLDIGLVGEGVTESTTYVDGADLGADIGAARAAGIAPERLDVYNLDGMLARAPAEQWLSGAAAIPAAPAEDAASLQIREIVGALDGVL